MTRQPHFDHCFPGFLQEPGRISFKAIKLLRYRASYHAANDLRAAVLLCWQTDDEARPSKTRWYGIAAACCKIRRVTVTPSDPTPFILMLPIVLLLLLHNLITLTLLHLCAVAIFLY